MDRQGKMALLQRCAEAFAASQTLSNSEDAELDLWWEGARRRDLEAIQQVAGRPAAEWPALILEHRACRHTWYRVLAEDVSVDDFATFMLENRYFPAFLPMAARALDAQVCETGREALRRNIADENEPVPHADLMRRLMMALTARAKEPLSFDDHETLADRTLAFYYGAFRQPWVLVGALYITEAVALDRLQGMDRGLRRLGFGGADLEFLDVHLACDEGHAEEWSRCVIEPTLTLRPDLAEVVAAGVAVTLETSARYLDWNLERVARRRGPDPAHAA